MGWSGELDLRTLGPLQTDLEGGFGFCELEVPAQGNTFEVGTVARSKGASQALEGGWIDSPGGSMGKRLGELGLAVREPRFRRRRLG